VYLDPNFILSKAFGYDPVLEHIELLEYFSSNTKRIQTEEKCVVAVRPRSPQAKMIVIYTSTCTCFLKLSIEGVVGGVRA
jgi:archaellum biogenesis ATPase FlaH